MFENEVLMEFDDLISGPRGRRYHARACGRSAEDGLWEGWIEFERIGGRETLRSPKETVQPNRLDADYWASGLTHAYLEGALARALDREEPVLPPQPLRRAPARAQVSS